MNNAINQVRFDNFYTPMTSKWRSLAKEITELATLSDQLEKECIKHNISVTDPTPIIQELNRMNDEIANYDVIESAQKLNAQEKMMHSI